MLRFITFLVLALSFFFGSMQAMATDASARFEALLNQDLEQIDFARAKLEFDQLIDPSIDVEARLAELDRMAEIATDMANDPNDPWSLYAALRGFLFDAGAWNNHRPFTYDRKDPWGQDFQNRLLSDYMDDRRGNCVTMPLLMLFVGQRMGLDLKLAHAPLHYLLKFDPKDGQTVNLEATSGGYPARLAHYQEHFPISDLALDNGIYMRAFNKRETLVSIALIVMEHDFDRARWMQAANKAERLLQDFCDFPYLLVRKSSAYARVLDRDFRQHYPTFDDIPELKKPVALSLSRANLELFTQAEALGWVPFIPEGYKPR